jgi:cytochrome c peroxidase
VDIGVRLKQSLVTMAALAAVTATCLAADTATVSQHGRRFTPDTLQVAVGSQVQIENDDRVTHHVYIDQPDMKFDSGEQSVGNAVTLKFDHTGTFAVRCAIHPTMRLDVTVVP